MATSLELSLLVCRAALGLEERQSLSQLCRQDPRACFEQQSREGLQGLLAYQLQAPERLQVEFGLAARMLGQLEEVDRAFSDAALEAVVLKGGSYHPAVYPVLGTRPVSDLDIWVPSGQLCQAEQVLLAMGYRGARPNFWREGSAVDLHTCPLNQLGRVFRPEPSWWAVRQPLEPWRALRRLPHEEALVLSALHGLKHAFGRLVWLLDVALLRRLACPLRTAELARQLGCLRSLRLCEALILELFFEQPVPGWRLALLQAVRSRSALGMLFPLFSEAPLGRKLTFALETACGGGGWARIGRLAEIARSLFRPGARPGHSDATGNSVPERRRGRPA